MICPKCQNQMRTLNKNGVHLEQCDGCRGIFLDRGELEQIVAAEGSYYGGGAPAPYPGGHAPRYGDSPKPFRGGHGDSPKPFRGGHGDSPRPYGGHGGGRGYSDSPRAHRGGHGYGDSPRAYGGHGHRRKGFLENLFD